MSRIAKLPVVIPQGVSVALEAQTVCVQKGNIALSRDINPLVWATCDASQIVFSVVDENSKTTKQAWMCAGTERALVKNMITGVHEGYVKKLELVGVGYRAAVKGNVLSLGLGYSHPIDYPFPEGITIETPSQTEILVKGADKQKVGQVAAEIRAFRPPEPYKGKGVRYHDERIVRKEVKKK